LEIYRITFVTRVGAQRRRVNGSAAVEFRDSCASRYEIECKLFETN